MTRPTSDDIRTAITNLMLQDADHVAAALARVTDDPTGCVATVQEALAAVRAEPLEYRTWSALGVATHRAFVLSGPTDAFDAWYQVKAALSIGEYRLYAMVRIVEAAAPICDAHGPCGYLTDSDTWQCSTGPDCRSSYWWIDGTHIQYRKG